MIPSNLVAMIRAEFYAVFRRGSGIGAMAVSVVIGLLAVLLMHWSQTNVGAAEVNGAPIGEMISYSGADCAGWALSGRNFFVLPLLLLFATGSSIAGELQDRSLREVLVRPIPRWSVLLAKLAALLGLSAATLLLALLPSLLLGMARFGSAGPVGDVLLGYTASLGTDLGIIAFGFVASTMVRSVGGVIVSVVLLLMVDTVARLMLWLYKTILGFAQQSLGTAAEEVPNYGLYLPGAALDCWKGWAMGWAWEPFVGLALLIAISFSVALVRFQRMDIA